MNKLRLEIIQDEEYHALNILETIAYNSHIELVEKYIKDNGKETLFLDDWNPAEQFILKLLLDMPTISLKIKVWIF